jgi:predicted permease
VLLVLVALVLATGAGVATERRLGGRIELVTGPLVRVLVWFVYPPIVFLVVAHLSFAGGAGIGLAFAWAELLIVGALAWQIATRVLRLPRPAVGSVVLGTTIVNTGYLGAPLVAVLLGRDALHAAIAFDSLVSNMMLYTVGYGVGAAFGTAAGETPRQRVKAFLTRNPVLYAAALGVVVPDALAPQALLDIAEVVAVALLPVGFFLLGINLIHEEHGLRLPPVSPPVAVVLVLRLAAAPLLLLALTVIFSEDVPDAYFVQAAMPSGINALVVGHVYGLDNQLTATIIAWTTIVAIAAVLAVSLVI